MQAIKRTNNAGFMVADEKEREHRANGYV